MKKPKRKLKLSSFAKGRSSVMVVDSEEKVVSSDWDRHPEIVKRKAKELYILYGWDVQKIHEEFGVPLETVRVWVYNPTSTHMSWKVEKDSFHSSVMDRLKADKAEELKEVSARAVGAIKRGLMELDVDSKPLTIAQMEKLTNMLGKLDHIVTLAEGKPTSINRSVATTQKEIDELLGDLDKLDPLMDYSPNKIN